MFFSDTTAGRWRQRFYAHLSLARISNSPTVASNVLAGAALGGVLVPNGAVLLLIIAMVLFYTAGMYLNDLFDYQIDLRERSDRPLPAGRVSRRTATAVVLLLFAVGSGLLWLVSSAAFLAGLVLVGLIVLYDAWHKTNPLSPVLMATTRMMVYVVAFLAFAPQPTGMFGTWTLLLGLYIVGLTYIAKLESRPGLTRYWPAILLFLPVLYLVVQSFGVSTLVLMLLFTGWVAYCLRFLYRKEGRSIGGAVGRLIAGVSLVDALVLGSLGSAVGAGSALAAFGLTLFFQRYIRGT